MLPFESSEGIPCGRLRSPNKEETSSLPLMLHLPFESGISFVGRKSYVHLRPTRLRLLPISHRIGRTMGAGEDLRTCGGSPRSALSPLSRWTLRWRRIELLGKTPTGAGDRPDDCAGRVAVVDQSRDHRLPRRRLPSLEWTLASVYVV